MRTTAPRGEGKWQLPERLPISLRLQHESSRNLDKSKEIWEVPEPGERRAGHLPGLGVAELWSPLSWEGPASMMNCDGFSVSGYGNRKQGGMSAASHAQMWVLRGLQYRGCTHPKLTVTPTSVCPALLTMFLRDRRTLIYPCASLHSPQALLWLSTSRQPAHRTYIAGNKMVKWKIFFLLSSAGVLEA